MIKHCKVKVSDREKITLRGVCEVSEVTWQTWLIDHEERKVKVGSRRAFWQYFVWGAGHFIDGDCASEHREKELFFSAGKMFCLWDGEE